MQRDFRFGRAELRSTERRLLIDGEPAAIGGRAFDLLALLVEQHHRVVTADELFATVWSGLVVEEHNLYVQVNALRKLLGAHAIATVPRRGYRFALPVEVCTDIAGANGNAAGAADAVAAADDVRPASDDGLAASARPAQSIAVLPFDEPDCPPGDEGLARAFVQDLLVELARNVNLRVISHHSSFAFAGTGTPLAEIGRRLRCAHLVDGSVRRDGARVRIRVEMVDVEAGDIVWADEQHADVTELPAARDRVVARIAGGLHWNMRQRQLQRTASRSPKSFDVVGLTARAIAIGYGEVSAGPLRESRRLLEEAIRLDPDYAPAWTSLAFINYTDARMHATGEWHSGRAAEIVAQARRAVELDGESPSAWRALAEACTLARDFDAALRHAQRSVALAPSHGESMFTLALTQFALGQLEEGRRSVEAALDRLPVPPAFVLWGHAFALWGTGDRERALQVAEQALLKQPALWPARLVRLYAFHELGRLDEARAEAQALLTAAPGITIELVLAARDDAAVALRARMRAAMMAAAGWPEG